MDADIMAWTNVIIDEEQVVAKTNRAVLIREPRSDWMVWASWKVVRKGSSSTNFSVGFNSEVNYRVFREGKDREILAEEHISGINVAERWRAVAPDPQDAVQS